MESVRILSANNQYADELIKLYIETFPLNQRHTEDDFKKMLETNERFYCNAVLMNKELVGFFHYWDLDNFIFLEHIAVEPPLRGHKLGEKIISLARSFISKPLVLEVETVDENEWSSRRIEYYRRLNFEIVPKEYRQPPYRKNGEYIRLHLMSDDLDYSIANYDTIVDQIYKNVYKIS